MPISLKKKWWTTYPTYKGDPLPTGLSESTYEKVCKMEIMSIVKVIFFHFLRANRREKCAEVRPHLILIDSVKRKIQITRIAKAKIDKTRIDRELALCCKISDETVSVDWFDGPTFHTMISPGGQFYPKYDRLVLKYSAFQA